MSLSKDGLNNGGNTITNVADGVNATDAVNKGQLDSAIASVNTDVTNITNNVSNINQIIGGDNYVNQDGSLTPEGQLALKTYNVQGQTEYVHNSVISAIKNMNEQGIKFFHTNDGQAFTADTSNTAAQLDIKRAILNFTKNPSSPPQWPSAFPIYRRKLQNTLRPTWPQYD